ncbi:MAG: hypothetical protein R3321_00255 [Nitrososphaeraceae archaeon]|nr:hypothetical protein [Nitrososphaeraceae archaeon]
MVKRLTIVVDDDFHAKIKTISKSLGMTIKDYVSIIIKESINYHLEDDLKYSNMTHDELRNLVYNPPSESVKEKALKALINRIHQL